MENYQKEFIELAIAQAALSFGDFTLKSGRKSPYFFNIGHFNDGNALAKLGSYYATALERSGLDYDLLFGPAYKGILLACSTVMSLATQYSRNVGYVFNRKEAKDHGEGGQLVGAPLMGRVVIVDDVMTAGTAVKESMNIIKSTSAELAGIIIALDRQERGKGESSSVQMIADKYGAPVISIITLNDLVSYLKDNQELADYLPAVSAYRDEWGANL